jgi:hypothetical protein
MAKDKNRKKGIVDPRKAERAAARAAGKAEKAKADTELQGKVDRANTIAASIRENRPEGTAPAAPSVTPPTELPQLDEDVKLGYAGRPIPRGERPLAKLDAADVADDALQAAAVREDEARQAKIDSGETVAPRTPLDVVRGIQERRASAEQERVAGMSRVDLPSAVGEGFDEVTDAEAARRASGRTARRGTGIVDFRDIASGGRESAGLSGPQQERAQSRLEGRVEKALAFEATGGDASTQGFRPYTDPPEILATARRLKTAELMDKGQEVTPEIVESGLQLGPHQRMARIIHHTGITAEQLRGYLGGRESIAEDKLNELHETVMNNVRSRRKNDVLPRMGLVRGEDGSITATEQAQNEVWQHPTEKDANGLPKTYKVSDMHPDMVKQLNHPWGGVQSENEFEGTAVMRETPAISDTAKKNPAARYAIANAKSAGDYLPVSIRFGHSKNAAGSWSFTPPPSGFSEGNLSDPEGFTSNVTHITNAIREGKSRPGTRKSHSEIANNLLAELDPAKQRMVGRQQVTVPMPGFTQTGGAPATTAYKPQIMDIPPAGDDSIVTYDDLPHVKDSNGKLVPLAPRSGRAGTGRSVHVVQGTMGLGQQFTSPAEESAKVLGGFEVTPATEKTRTRKKKDGTEKVTVTQVPGVASNVAEGQMVEGNRSSQSRRLIRGNRAVGKQFMGVEGVEPRYRGKQSIIPGFENYGNVERERGIPAVINTKYAEGPLPAGVDTRSEAGLVERKTILNAEPARTINSPLSDSRMLRQRAEAESGRGVIGAVEQPAPAKKSDYTQDELDFNPTAPGVVRTRQFMLGTVRPLTDAEQSVENVGANTIRGMNPPARNFDVGSPAATAAPATTAPAISSGEIELSKRGGGRRKLQKGEKVVGTSVRVGSTKGGAKSSRTRPLKRPPNSAALAE